VQNLPQNHLPSLSTARGLVCDKNLDGVQAIYGNVPDTLSQLIRTAFIPAPGCKFAVADFSAIEARVIAWLAGEQWVMDVFATHGKIYEAAASQMFGVPIDQIAKGQPQYGLRAKGKVATLALGYQGGAAALIAMGALRQGLTEEELPEIVQRWRQANRRIVALWYSLEAAATEAIKTGRAVGAAKGLVFSREIDRANGQDFLTIRLPSGRKLFYTRPGIGVNRWGRDSISYWGVGDNKKFAPLETYGGKITENVVQAIARDCLAESIVRLHSRGFLAVMHIHDEVVVEVQADHADKRLDDIVKLMGEPIPWAPGLLLKADGFTGEYYRKE